MNLLAESISLTHSIGDDWKRYHGRIADVHRSAAQQTELAGILEGGNIANGCIMRVVELKPVDYLSKVISMGSPAHQSPRGPSAGWEVQ